MLASSMLMLANIGAAQWRETGRLVLDNPLIQILLTFTITLVVHIVLRAVIGMVVERLAHQHQYRSELDEYKRAKTLKGVMRTLVAVLLWIVAILIMLQQAGVNLATLATGAGLFGVIFGFGAQSAVKDFVSGLCIIGENQYRVGDIIKLQVGSVAISGTVEELTIRITRLRDLDGNVHTVSNGTPTAVTNLSYEYANVNINIGVSYDADIDTVEKVINQVGQAMLQDEKWAADIFEPITFLRVDDFGDSAVRVKALGKVEPAAQWAVAGEFRRRIKPAFDAAGVNIPYPHLVVQQVTSQQGAKK